MDKGTIGRPSGHPENRSRKPGCSALAGRADKGAAIMALRSELYPAVTRALALIQENEGGPLPILEDSHTIPARWQPYLPLIEAAIASLANDRPAQEDDEAIQMIAREGWHASFSEFHSFCIGRRRVIASIAARSRNLAIADNFLADFFECWRLYDGELCAPDASEII